MSICHPEYCVAFCAFVGEAVENVLRSCFTSSFSCLLLIFVCCISLFSTYHYDIRCCRYFKRSLISDITVEVCQAVLHFSQGKYLTYSCCFSLPLQQCQYMPTFFIWLHLSSTKPDKMYYKKL